MGDLITRLRNINAGGAYSRVRYEAAVRIEALERENARLRRQFAEEKALADRLRNAATSIGVTNIPWREADAAYRKARGL